MNSKNADVQNINYVGGAGSTTAEIFARIYFKQNTMGSFRYCWYGFSKYGGALNSGGATGWCQLLNELMNQIMNNLEQTLSIIKRAVERNLNEKIKDIFIKNNLKIKESKKIPLLRKRFL